MFVDNACGGNRCRGHDRCGCDDGRNAETMREVLCRVYDVQTINEVVRHHHRDDGGGVITISGRLGHGISDWVTLLPEECEGSGPPRYALMFKLSSDGGDDNDGNGGDGGRGLEFELRVEGGGKDAVVTATATTTMEATPRGDADD